MKLAFTKREAFLGATALISFVLLVAVSVYAVQLRNENRQNEAAMAADDTLLQQKDASANQDANYTETVCAEYRKLYQAYSKLRAQNPAITESYALPGSAKGEVDECYQQ